MGDVSKVRIDIGEVVLLTKSKLVPCGVKWERDTLVRMRMKRWYGE